MDESAPKSYLGILNVPLGIWVGSRAGSFKSRLIKAHAKARLDLILSPVVLIICLAILAVLRLA